MKIVFSRTILVLFILLAFNATQAQTTGSNPVKVVLINSYLFQEPGTGIKKLLGMQSSLETEFKTKMDEVKQMQTKLEKYSSDIKKSTSLTDQSRMTEEYEKLLRDYNSKTETIKLQYEKRQNDLMKPLNERMQNLIQQWCKEKGFTALLDISRNQDGLVFYIDEEEVNKTTGEFISYMNARL